MVPFLLAVVLATVPVESVVAVVNGVPVLASDVELAEIAGLVPPQDGEDAATHEHAVVEALIALELRWQDLRAAAIVERTQIDVDAIWERSAQRTGGEARLLQLLDDAGLSADGLRYLLRRAAVVQAYVAERFEPFVEPTEAEIESAWNDRLVPELRARGQAVPALAEVHDRVATLVHEEKLLAEVERWTDDLARRAEIVRYRR